MNEEEIRDLFAALSQELGKQTADRLQFLLQNIKQLENRIAQVASGLAEAVNEWEERAEQIQRGRSVDLELLLQNIKQLENRIAQVAAGLADRINVLEQCGDVALVERVTLLERKIRYLETKESI